MSTSLPHVRGYRIIRLLGRGGMGDVYLAREEAGEGLVALKVLGRRFLDDDVNFERFVREAILTSQVRHPNIVHVKELGEDRGAYYICMEYVEGFSLRERLRQGAMSVAQSTVILCQVLAAMDEVHGQGIVHCDLKPGNILLAGGIVPKVSDLGIAHTRGPIHGDSTLPVVGRATPFYVAPEQCVASGKVDRRTDIYALGATLYHMVCGLPPFVGRSSEECVEQHLHTPAPDPRKANARLGQGMAELILRMLAKDPENRPESCGGLVEPLRQAAASHQEGLAAAASDLDLAAEAMEETAFLQPPE